MIKNVGTVDRVVRIVLAAVIGIVLLAKMITGAWAVVAGIAVVVLFGTGFIGWCGLYRVIGLNTCKPCRSHKGG